MFSKSELMGIDYCIDLLRRTIRLYNDKIELQIVLSSIILLDNKYEVTFRDEAIQYISNSFENNPEEPFNYLLNTCLYCYSCDNYFNEYLDNLQLFFEKSSQDDFLIFNDQVILGIVENCILFGGKLGEIDNSISLIKKYKNKLLRFCKTETSIKVDQILGYFNNNEYIMDSQYLTKYDSASFKYNVELYNDALLDAEIALDKCENCEMNHPDIDLISDLIFAIKLQLNDFDWLKRAYKEMINYCPQNIINRWDYAQLCMKNHYFDDAIKELIYCVDYLKEIRDEGYRKYLHYLLLFCSKNEIIQFIILDIVECFNEMKKVGDSEKWLKIYGEYCHPSFEDSFYYERVNRAISIKFNKSFNQN